MSFVGVLRPLVQGAAPGRRADVGPPLFLVVGFTASAVAFFALTATVGAAATALAGQGPARWSAAAAVIAALVAVDHLRRRAGTWYGPGWRRQTPQRFVYQYGPRWAALLWGLDAGLVVTTFRITSATWAAVVLSCLGLVPWWAGAAYAAGFGVPVAALVLGAGRARAQGDTRDDAVLVTQFLIRCRAWVQTLVTVALAAGAAGCLGAAVVSAG